MKKRVVENIQVKRISEALIKDNVDNQFNPLSRIDPFAKATLKRLIKEAVFAGYQTACHDAYASTQQTS